MGIVVNFKSGLILKIYPFNEKKGDETNGTDP